MADPAKDYYQERLVQAWSAAMAAGYAPQHAVDTSAHSQVNSSFTNKVEGYQFWGIYLTLL